MGCSCLGHAVKIKSNIVTSSTKLYFPKKKGKISENRDERNLENFLKSYRTKISTECSNISSSCMSVSNDEQENDKRDDERIN